MEMPYDFIDEATRSWRSQNLGEAKKSRRILIELRFSQAFWLRHGWGIEKKTFLCKESEQQ